MRRSSIRLSTDALGCLSVDLPRVTYGALALVLALAAGLMVTRWGDGVGIGLEAPAWAWWGAMGLFIAFAAAFGMQALCGRALVFDARRSAVMRGERVVARFEDVSHVELLERRGTERHRHWVLRVHRAGGGPIFVGRENSREDADHVGARLASVLGKPVRHVAR